MNATSEFDRDDMVLEQLSLRGDVGAIARPVFVWVYGTEEELRLASTRMTAGDWEIELEEADERWVLRAQREQIATQEAIHAMSAEILAAIEGTEADYDGWETSVERSH